MQEDGTSETLDEYHRLICQFSERESRATCGSQEKVRGEEREREKEAHAKREREKKKVRVAKRKKRTSTLLDFPTYSAGSLIRGDAV